ncbi:hypothetical protein MP638_003723 [Amoeboaphelidium occidentale]|nr:hypothetical protein MP638_003723 [Amoeboaphelidium occidentale]
MTGANFVDQENLSLQEKVKMYEACLNALPDAITIENRSGQSLFVNMAAKKQQAEGRRIEIPDLEGCIDVESKYIVKRVSPNSTQVLSSAFDELPHLVWITDPNGDVTYYNQVFNDYTGTYGKEMHGKRWDTMVHPDDFERTREEWCRSLQEEGEHNIEHRLRHHSGDYRWFLTRARPLYDADGQLIHWFGTCTDIHKSKTIEESLRKAEAELTAERRIQEFILNHLPVAVLMAKAPSGEVFYANDKYADVWRQPLAPIASISSYKQVKAFRKDGRPYEPMDWPLARSVATGEVVRNEDTDVEFCDGTRGVVRLNSKPLYDEKGNISHAVVICEDLTEKLKMDELRVQLLGREQAALESSRMKSEFLANMSHEIRTPLNGILGMAETLKEDTSLSPTQLSYVSTIAKSGQLLLTVINDILDFSKIEAGKLELEMNPVDICKCLKLVESLMMPAATRKGIDLKFNLPEVMPPSLIGDRDRIQQVVLNLVSNAIKFTERGGVKVTLKCDVHQNENMADLEFCIEDTGIGIHPDALKRLFQPFVQADTSTTRKFGGTGLGLSIVKSLVGLMGGEVFSEPNPGGGSKFCVHIKLPVSNTTPLSPKEEKAPVFMEHLKVLIAEDNPINQKIAKMALNRISIKNVDVVENGQLAVDKFFEQGDYDVVLMDVQMPILDGKKATKLIRSKEVELGRKRTPIIALTASALKTDQEECLEAGMDTHIAKPYSHVQLKEKLSSIIN